MTKEIIQSVDKFEEIVNKYSRKGGYTNNYLLPEECGELIKRKHLFVCYGINNVFLFVQKDKCQRIYYYLNDLEEIISLDNNEDYVVEILFRGELRYPQKEVEYLQKCGLRVHLVRDQYEAKYADLQPSLSVLIPEEVIIRYAQNNVEAKYAIDLFNSLFDPYSGDFIPENGIESMINKRELLLALHENKPCGALHIERNRVCWIAHLAVGQAARGKHIASALVKRYVEMNYVDDKTRYAVWVQHQNEPAVNLYKKSGFKYINKSTLSMLKLK